MKSNTVKPYFLITMAVALLLFIWLGAGSNSSVKSIDSMVTLDAESQNPTDDKKMIFNDVMNSHDDSSQDQAVSDGDFVRIKNYLDHVDRNQNEIVYNHKTLMALDDAFGYVDLSLSVEGLDQLKQRIRSTYSGQMGEQLAELSVNYYRFLEARKEFDEQYRTTEGIEQLRREFDELQALRATYLGQAVAHALFKKANTDALFMLDSMTIEQDKSLADVEKQSKQNALTNRHMQDSIDIPQWESRRQAFLKAKQQIVMSNLSEDEKQNQVNQLYHQHFNEAEINMIQFLKLGQL